MQGSRKEVASHEIPRYPLRPLFRHHAILDIRRETALCLLILAASQDQSPLRLALDLFL